MENVVYFDLEKYVNGELITFRKFFNLETNELVDIDDDDMCNFVALPEKMDIHCVAFCD